MTQPLVDQPDAMPTRKVMAGGLAGAAVTVAIFLIQQYKPGFTVDEPVVAAFTTIVAAAFAYFVRDRANVPAVGNNVMAPAE